MALPSRRKFVILGFISIGSLNAQEVFTNPVGFVRLGNTTAGEPAVQANTDVFLSIPLETKLEASGVVASTTATSITFANSPAWTTSPEQWAPNPTPFCVIITSGDENGLRALVTANTDDTLTVSLTSPGDLLNVSAGDTVVIRECWTLQTFFASMDIPNDSQILLRDETLTGINQVADFSAIAFDGNWFSSSDFSDVNDVILHPGESFVLRSTDEIASLTTAGDVSTSNLRNAVQRDGNDVEDLFIASMSPVPSLLIDSSIPAQNDDIFLVFSPEGSGTNRPASSSFIFSDGSWFDAGSFEEVTDTLTISPGVGYVLRRADTSPSFEEWTQLAPYTN